MSPRHRTIVAILGTSGVLNLVAFAVETSADLAAAPWPNLAFGVLFTGLAGLRWTQWRDGEAERV